MGGGRLMARNAAAILAGDVVGRGATFVVYALVARRLGVYAFGQLALALTLFAAFQVLATGGLKTLLTRELARDRDAAARAVSSGSALVAAFAALATALLLGFVALMGYSADTALVVVLVGLGMLPSALTAIYEATLQAWERMEYIAYANVPVSLAKVGLAALLLGNGRGVIAVAGLLLAAQWAVAGAERWLLARQIAPLGTRPDRETARGLLAAAWTFLGIEGVVAVTAALNAVLLSRLAGEPEVGLYSAAAQLSVPVALVYQSIAVSVYPALCRSAGDGPGAMLRVAGALLELEIALVLPAVVGLWWLAGPIVELAYGAEFGLAAGVLRVGVWALIPIVITQVLGRVLYAGGRERTTLRIVVVDLLVALAAGALLIAAAGPAGAAAATVLTWAVDLAQHLGPARRLLGRVPLLAASWRAAAASAVMVGVLAAARAAPLVVAIPLGAAAYGATWLALALVFGRPGGGFRPPGPAPRGDPEDSADTRLRVALVTFDFGQYCVRLASALAREAAVLLLITEAELAPHRAELDPAVELRAFRHPRLRQAARQIRLVRDLVAQIRAFRPDVVHVQHRHLWLSLAMPALRRYPLVVTVHDPCNHSGDRESGRTPALAAWLTYRGADRVIVHGERLRREAVARLGLPGGRVRVVPMPALGCVGPPPAGEPERPCVLFFGRIWAYKGLEYLILAEPLISAEVPEVTFVIAGRGDDLAPYRRLMRHPERFTVLDRYIADDEVGALFAGASVVALPYVDASASGVIPVAFSYGRPVVATDVGSLPELVEDEMSGLIVPPRDPEALAAAVVRLLRDTGLRRRLGAAGRLRAEIELAPAAVARQTLAVYREAVAARAAGGRGEGEGGPAANRPAHRRRRTTSRAETPWR
jgi:O-antigen/teichoic acid export membrane protein/glycosyltransferase involved in cell wall biosynthesis